MASMRSYEGGPPVVEIRALDPHEFDRLEPLWRALHEHHVRISPRLAGMPVRSAHESWARGRADYIRWAGDPDTFVLVAEVDREFVGYAFVTLATGYSSWDSGERQAQLATLTVSPSFRGQGVGGRLLAAVRERLAMAGVESLALSAVCANDGAHRFYERHGFRRAEIVFVAATTRHRQKGTQHRPARHAAELLLRALRLADRRRQPTRLRRCRPRRRHHRRRRRHRRQGRRPPTSVYEGHLIGVTAPPHPRATRSTSL